MNAESADLASLRFKNFCTRWQIVELSLFGSILRDDFNADSDIDILVEFSPTAPWDLLDLIAMQQALEKIFNRKVDLIEKCTIETSHNWIRRKEILNTAKVIYSQNQNDLLAEIDHLVN